MRLDVAHGRAGHLHEAAVYRSDDELLSVLIPFLRQGLDAGDPVFVCLTPQRAELLRTAFADPDSVIFLDHCTGYRNPATAVKYFRELVDQHVRHGASKVRLAGELDEPGSATPWGPWARYEAAVNHLLDDLPLWSLCMYDGRTTPATVLDDVLRTHPWLALPGGRHVPSTAFTDPPAFLSAHVPAPGEPGLRSKAPAVTLRATHPEQAREAAREAGRQAGLGETRLGELVLAVSESVTNALHHGRPPVWLRLWPEHRRVVATVTDAGEGPKDPYAGLTPLGPNRADGGLGLWIVHQVCDYVAMRRHEDGYTIVLVAGEHSR